jgi:hypothetical protein
MENNNFHNQSVIEKYKCTKFYTQVVECVKNHEKHDKISEKICKQEFINLGQCIINAQKEEEKQIEIQYLKKSN